MVHVKLPELLKLLFGVKDWLEVQMVLQTLEFLQVLGEVLDIVLRLSNHSRTLRQINALRGELVTIFQEVLQLLILCVKIIQHEVFIFDHFYEVIQSNALLIQLFDVVFDEVLQIVLMLNTKIPLELLDAAFHLL